jgi:hypothetical protein
MRTIYKASVGLILILFSIDLLGQVIPDPEFTLRPYYLTDSTLTSFDRVDSEIETKVIALGYGGAESFFATTGLKSKTRFLSSSIPRIIISTEDNTDPADIITISKAEFKGNKRRFKAAKVGYLGLKNKEVNDSRVSVSFKKIRPKVYEMIFDNPLTPGEYAIMPYFDKNSSTGVKFKLNCFGVD